MKNKIITIYGVIILLLLVLILVFYYTSPEKKMNNTGGKFSSEDLINSNFLKNNYTQNDNKVLLFASTDCDYCDKTINFIKENNPRLFSNNELIIIFNAKVQNVISFLEKAPFLISDSIYIYIDKNRALNSKMNVTVFPTIFIINKEKITNKAEGLDESKILINKLSNF